MRGKKRPAAEKGTAVGIALMTTAEEASRQTGIPGRTIRAWVESPEFAELRQTPREEVGEAMWVAIQEAVHQLQQGLTNPKAYLRDKVAAFEALVTKRALIVGEATSREETKDITRDDYESELLGEVVRAELARRADEHAAELAVESAAPTGAETTSG
jgi:hypothetical protein